MTKFHTLIATGAIFLTLSGFSSKQTQALEKPKALSNAYSSTSTVSGTVSGTVKGSIYILKGKKQTPVKNVRVRIYTRANNKYKLTDTVQTDAKGNYNKVLTFQRGQKAEVMVDPITTNLEKQGYKVKDKEKGSVDSKNPLIINFVAKK